MLSSHYYDQVKKMLMTENIYQILLQGKQH